MSIDTLQKKFTCPRPASLSLTNIRGSVTIQAGEDGVIIVSVSKHTDTGDADNTHIELSQTEAGEVIAATKYDHNGFGFFRQNLPCEVDYEIQVPAKCSLKVRGVSNPASIDGISGKKDIKSISGDISLRKIEGEINVKTVSGDINGIEIWGVAQLKVVSGDVDISQADFPALRGKSVSGDMNIESPLGDGPYDFNTVSGDIRFVVPQLRGVSIRSNTFSGKVKTPEPATKIERYRNHRKIVLGDGNVEISHQSISGDFSLVNKGENGSSPGSLKSADESVKTESKIEILDRVARGDLSVEEALNFIKNNPETEQFLLEQTGKR